MGDGNSNGTDRWDREQELKKLYNLTDQEATVYIAVMDVGRDKAMEYLGLERQTVKNLLSYANKKIKKADTTMLINIVRPTEKLREATNCAVEIVSKFYAETTGAEGRYGAYTITLLGNDPEVKGEADWMDAYVFSAVTITDAKTTREVDDRVNRLLMLYTSKAEGKQMMGWSVLKRKIDQLYVKSEIL